MNGWRGPRYKGEFPSLGPGIDEWVTKYLVVPSGPMVGQPLELTDEQYAFLVKLYRIDPVTGDRVYRRGCLRRPKGWGKSPLLAAIAIAELCGPVVFGGWDDDGEPAGKEHGSPWVQIAACSEDQTDNTYVALFEMLRDSPAVEEFALDVGLTRVFLKGRPGRLEPVTASSGSREGQPVTFAVLDETHLWLPNNGGKKLAATIRRNVAKMGGSTVESTNAYVPGEQSVAERTETAKGKEQKGLLLDTGPEIDLKEADLKVRSKAFPRLEKAYGDSAKFVGLERIYQDATDADTEPADALRFYFNMIVKGSEQAFDSKRWAELAKPETVIADKEIITLGFDGARTKDATAIVATHVDSGYQWLVAVWERPDVDEWLIPADEVEAVLETVFDRYTVWRAYCDPHRWETEVDGRWPAKWGDAVISWDTRHKKQMAYALKAYVTAMRAGDLSHDGDSRFAQHIANARKQETLMLDDGGSRLWVIHKEHDSSPNKIDIAMAGTLSWQARLDCIKAGGNHKRSNRAVFF